MKISVSSTNPNEAAALANGVAEQFAAFAARRTEQLTSSYRQAVDTQIEKTSAEIATGSSPSTRAFSGVLKRANRVCGPATQPNRLLTTRDSRALASYACCPHLGTF